MCWIIPKLASPLLPLRKKNMFHETGPWCQNFWALLLKGTTHSFVSSLWIKELCIADRSSEGWMCAEESRGRWNQEPDGTTAEADGAGFGTSCTPADGAANMWFWEWEKNSRKGHIKRNKTLKEGWTTGGEKDTSSSQMVEISCPHQENPLRGEACRLWILCKEPNPTSCDDGWMHADVHPDFGGLEAYIILEITLKEKFTEFLI